MSYLKSNFLLKNKTSEKLYFDYKEILEKNEDKQN